MKKITMLFLLSFFVLSCTPAGTTIKKTDSFTGKESICFYDLSIAVVPLSGYSVYLSACKITGNEDILLTVVFKGSKWIFIEENDSLLIKLDTGIIKYSGKKISTDIYQNASVMEKYGYLVKKDFFEKIINNKEKITGRLIGKNGFVDLDLFGHEYNLKQMRNYLDVISGKTQIISE